jgi:hypothetical protein
VNPAAFPRHEIFVPLSAGKRDRLAAHAEELRLAGQVVVAEIIEEIVAAYDHLSTLSLNGRAEE